MGQDFLDRPYKYYALDIVFGDGFFLSLLARNLFPAA